MAAKDSSLSSDHLTVWVDDHIGKEENNQDLKDKFDKKVQVLKTMPNELEIDPESMMCTDPKLLADLSAEAYCLKYFSKIETALAFIRNSSTKTIFFISSGSIGKEIVPRLVELSNVKEIYIFCRDISEHVEWAEPYTDRISNFFQHQDDLLERLTNDIGKYLEAKGDQFVTNDAPWQAKNCYAWAQKLYLRNVEDECMNSRQSLRRVKEKMESIQCGSTCTS